MVVEDNKLRYSSTQGVNPGIVNSAKFKNLRNRRGIKRYKMVQTRLDFSMVIGGDEKFRSGNQGE